MKISMHKFWALVLVGWTLITGGPAAQADDLLGFQSTYDISPRSGASSTSAGRRNGCYGKTYFTFMKDTVKPALDRFATQGFEVADGDALVAALEGVDDKVSRNATRDAGGERGLREIGDALAGKKTTFYDLQEEIAAVPGFRGDKYGLTTYIALASGGGVAMKLDDDNYFYNVNYGTGKQKDDERTGRSFGKGPLHEANDASDKMYLQELERTIRQSPREVSDFYRTVMEVLTNCDTRGYDGGLSGISETTATDFLAIYTAEQDRHLMANLRSHHWDTALLQVTLLGAFHAGQSKIQVYYGGKFTGTTYKQSPDNLRGPSTKKKADLTDWWQFSRQGNGRSGINITRSDFEKLSSKITQYERRKNPELVEAVERLMPGTRRGGDLFVAIADYLVNFKTPASLGMNAYDLTEAVVAFLEQVRTDADRISKEISGGATAE